MDRPRSWFTSQFPELLRIIKDKQGEADVIEEFDVGTMEGMYTLCSRLDNLELQARLARNLVKELKRIDYVPASLIPLIAVHDELIFES